MMKTYNKEALTEIIQDRQSVYPLFYSGEKIPNKTVEWMLKNAIQAPSHRKINPWRYRVLTGDKLTELAAFFQKTYKENVPKEKFSERKYNDFSKKLGNTSHVILITMQEDSEKPLPQWENVAAVSCALQNLYLSVTASGYGGYWSSPTLMIKNIENFVKLNENETCLGFFYLGFPKEELPKVMPKGELSDYVTWM